MLAKRDFDIWLSSYRSHSASITLRKVHHQLSCRDAPSSSSVPVASILLLVFPPVSGIPKCSVLLRSQLVIPPGRRAYEIRTLHKWLFRQSVQIVQRLKTKFQSLTKRFELHKTTVLRLSRFCSLFRKKRRSQPMLVHQCRCSPEADLGLALLRNACRVLRPFEKPN